MGCSCIKGLLEPDGIRYSSLNWFSKVVYRLGLIIRFCLITFAGGGSYAVIFVCGTKFFFSLETGAWMEPNVV
jgi:hypothetical protein